MCYMGTSEVAVLSGALLEEKFLLSRQNGLSYCPLAILYDDTTHQLIISYLGPRDIDYFQVKNYSRQFCFRETSHSRSFAQIKISPNV